MAKLLGGFDMPMVQGIGITMNVYLTPFEMQQMQALVILGGTGVLVDVDQSELSPKVQALIRDHRLHPGWLIAAVVGDAT